MEVRIERRHFAMIARLPFLARLQVRDPRLKPRGFRRVVSKAARGGWGLLHYRLGLPARGEMTFAMSGGRAARVGIDAAQALYIDYASRDTYGGYEPAETLLIDAVLPKIGVFYDIGANWGYYSWLAATRDGFSGRIYSFEIAPRMIAELNHIRAEAGFDNVNIMPFGLSDRSGSVFIADGRYSHLTRVVAPSDRASTTAMVRRLDDLDLPPPDFIKLDVEDHELAVLRGASRTIAMHRPAILFECRDPEADDVADLLALLESHGYLFHLPEICEGGVRLTETTAPPPGTSNILALPADRRNDWFMASPHR